MSQENEIEERKPSLTTDFLPSDGATCSALGELVSFVENVVRYGALTHDTDKRKAIALLRKHKPTSEVLPRDTTPTVAVKGRPWGSGPEGAGMRLLD